MPANKLALLRYQLIDKCLQNRFRKWTLNDLIETVSDGLYEYEGIDSGVSKRTIQLDLQNMRSDKLGYNAPIIIQKRKYYTYEDKEYSISKMPLSHHDLEKLNEVVGMLKQFKGFEYFNDLAAAVTRLEDKVLKQKNAGQSFIEFDKNEQLKGIEHLDPLHRAIGKRQTLSLEYQSFKAKQPSTFHFFPYLLKEYNNRWFLLGRKANSTTVLTIALDRIAQISIEKKVPYEETENLDINTYFQDVIGVSITPRMRPITVVLRLQLSQLPYITTKPIHPSQKVEKIEEEIALISLKVMWNYELEREIIGLGEVVEVISPRRLRNKVKARLYETLRRYDDKSE
ncbi:MAG: helix-turn-helix transcriptional regulator [Saprospiraceae bacterium]